MNTDAILISSFGGPERREDVLPFLDNVLRGRNVPEARKLEVAEHYYHFGGRSPINDQNRALIAALRDLLAAEGPELPIYWGNRNWHPFLADTLREMVRDGVRRAAVFATSAFGSYSGCRQYLDDLDRARQETGASIELEMLPLFYNHPGFIGAMSDRVTAALAQAPGADLIFTAHSVPLAMSDASPYVRQLEAACRLVANEVGRTGYTLAYQSRSGAPTQPWLEPDILDVLRQVRSGGVVIVPIGFVSDHMEVIYDLDVEARALADSLGLTMVRAGTAGTHPLFVRMIRDLVVSGARRSCDEDCCPRPMRSR